MTSHGGRGRADQSLTTTWAGNPLLTTRSRRNRHRVLRRLPCAQVTRRGTRGTRGLAPAASGHGHCSEGRLLRCRRLRKSMCGVHHRPAAPYRWGAASFPATQTRGRTRRSRRCAGFHCPTLLLTNLVVGAAHCDLSVPASAPALKPSALALPESPASSSGASSASRACRRACTHTHT